MEGGMRAGEIVGDSIAGDYNSSARLALIVTS